MHIASYSFARANLKAVIDKIVADHAPVAVTRQHGERAVIISQSQWELMEKKLGSHTSRANVSSAIQ